MSTLSLQPPEQIEFEVDLENGRFLNLRCFANKSRCDSNSFAKKEKKQQKYCKYDGQNNHEGKPHFITLKIRSKVEGELPGKRGELDVVTLQLGILGISKVYSKS